jgi:hypothetical protein
MKRRLQCATKLGERRCEVVLPLAKKCIELDLDDGVKINYQEFPGLLARIPSFDKKDED